QRYYGEGQSLSWLISTWRADSEYKAAHSRTKRRSSIASSYDTYGNMLADLNPYFMAGHSVPWQRAARATEDTAGSSSCGVQFTSPPLMLPSIAQPGTSLPAREEQQDTEACWTCRPPLYLQINTAHTERVPLVT
ncbi:hypothetical protein DNTS_032531, partial [Danionella cerebrum]